MNDDIETRDRRFTLKGWHLVVAILLVLVGLITLFFVARRSTLERRLQALRTAGYPTSFAELAEYTKLPEGVENAGPVYARAFAVYVPPVDGPNVPVLGQAQSPDRGAPLPQTMVQAVAKCLADNQMCLTLLHEAAGIEHCRYDWDYRQFLPVAADWRHGAQLLRLATTHYAEQGNPDAAVACIKDGLRLSDSLRREPALVSYLLRIAGIAVALAGLERSLSLTAFTDQQLQDLDAVLTRTGDKLDLAGVLVTERCFMIEVWGNASMVGSSGQSMPVPRVPGMRSVWLADILDTMEDRIEASKLPPIERLQRFRAADEETRRLSFLHVITKNVTPAMTRVAELDVRARAHLALAQTALALERYRLATGRVPEQLAELVPRYLDRVPLDPFDNQPIRYRRTEPGYLLYSVDTDGQDNGGREQNDQNRSGPYDRCFIVTR